MGDVVTLQEICQGGLCIGCGLCESIANADHVQMVMTPEGRERPLVKQALDNETLETINAVCPGLTVSGPSMSPTSDKQSLNDMWGLTGTMVLGHASDPEIRFRAAAGGGLTGLATFLLESGYVERIAHVKADPAKPMRSVATISTTPQDVLNASGSRYGPAAPLTTFMQLLDDGVPFAFVGKPCDVDTIRALERIDDRVAALCRVKLALVCGGASELTKSSTLLAKHDIDESDVTVFRYRGYGNPGRTRIETADGKAIEYTYNEMWDDEGTWQLQFRCKICPDAIGEHADIAVLDCWPGGGPTGEDAGFNAFIVRTDIGERVFTDACDSQAITVTGPVSLADLDSYQPHQVRKKHAVRWRLAAMKQAGVLTPRFEQLRLESFAYDVEDERAKWNVDGMLERIARGATTEPPVQEETNA